MPRRTRPLLRSILTSCALYMTAGAALAQSPPVTGVVPDDELTLVVGTRFVTPPATDASAKTLFTDARIPLTAFNDTDHCVDQTALDVAKDYFTTLGRMLGKAGYYYFVPDDEIAKAVAMCERMHGKPPHALADKTTKVIAFGKVVPETEAAALERLVR